VAGWIAAMGGEHHSAAMTEPDARAKLWLVTCSCGWTRECVSRWAAESVAKLHPKLGGAGIAHTVTIEGPPAEDSDGPQLPLIQRGTLRALGACHHTRHPPEGEGPPSRGRPFGLTYRAAHVGDSMIEVPPAGLLWATGMKRYWPRIFRCLERSTVAYRFGSLAAADESFGRTTRTAVAWQSRA
jgi:hypothetical protein